MNWVCIDFGTSNTAAAIDINGTPHVVAYGNDRVFPTIACVEPDGTITVCQNAAPLRTVYPESFLQEFKLDIAGPLDLDSVTYTDIVMEILKFVRRCAAIENNNEPAEGVILTIPAIFTEKDPRKQVLADAAIKAGFSSVEFIGEPEAAAICYSRAASEDRTGLSLVYDLGGGTFDAALLDRSDSSERILGYEAGTKCGGEYFDKKLYRYIAGLSAGAGRRLDPSRKWQDYNSCRQIKESLSVDETAAQIFSDGLKHTVSRNDLNQIIADDIDLTIRTCDRLLTSANRKWSDLSQVLLVGGSSSMPIVTDRLAAHLEANGAPDVRLIRNFRSAAGEYNYRWATCMGGLINKIQSSFSQPTPPPAPTRHNSNPKPAGFKCSRCGRITPEYPDGIVNFCNYCGAPANFLSPAVNT